MKIPEVLMQKLKEIAQSIPPNMRCPLVKKYCPQISKELCEIAIEAFC